MEATTEETKQIGAELAAELNDVKQQEFRIVSMRMKDAEKGQVLWEEDNWDLATDDEKQCSFPKEMLACTAVGREITFFSKKVMHDFAIKQVMSMGGQVVEEFQFDFGFVIPGSTNTWEQVIDADVGQVMPAEVLSGNLEVDTYFMVKNIAFAHQKYRIFYV